MSDKESWGFEAGDEIVPGRYAIEHLGGGHGFETYLAWDEELFSNVVVKILRPDHVARKSYQRKLRREWRVLRKLNHPVIMRGFACVKEGSRPHLVLEHLPGPTLHSMLSYGPLDVPQAVQLALHLCSALHYMEQKEVVHLDVKPANIVMGNPPRLIDLGIARSLRRAAELEGAIGTRQYMAPEQCLPGERGVVGPPADIWAVGAVLYRSVTKKRPYPSGEDDAEDPYDEYPQLKGKIRPLPDSIPEPVRSAVMACLALDPTDRPSARELVIALEPMLDNMPSRPRRVSPTPAGPSEA